MKPHVLFVDDEPQLLEAVQARLHKYRRTWDLSFCLGPEAALERIRQSPPHVVVSDVRMPQMDGAELLSHVRDLAPGATRIALSGQTDTATAARVLSVAHQFISKPCDITRIVDIVERRVRIESMVAAPEVVALVASCPDVPPAPRTYLELNAMLARTGWSLDEAALIVESDAVLTARLVQVAASPYFGLRRVPSTVRDAVRMLGIEAVRQLVLALEVRSAFPPVDRRVVDVEAISKHASDIAHRMMELAGPDTAGEAFVTGLVHDVGTLVLAATRPTDLGEVRRRAEQSGLSHSELERQTWGYTHAEVGAALLALWGVPCTLVMAVLKHGDASDDSPLGMLLRQAHLAHPDVDERSIAAGKDHHG